MPGERLNIQLRLRTTAKRAAEEISAHTGASREEALNMLILAGIPVVFERLGIQRDPATTVCVMLDAMGDQWDDTLTGEEIEAVALARKAMGRIAEIRNRDAG
jgi:hypothetical protein